jgi:mono/diheme cytochrome c family protein
MSTVQCPMSMGAERGARGAERPNTRLHAPRATHPAPRALLFALCALLLAGCTREGKFQPVSMWNESRIKPMEPSPMPGELSSARRIPDGAIARGQLQQDDPVNTGRSGGKLVTTSPVPITEQVLERGQEQYNVYCSPCHSRLGDGLGMVVQRGFPHPPDYAIKRLRQAPVGHFYDVITNGYGVMYSYADRVQPRDRWAISAYIRVLQAARKEVPEERFREERERARLKGVPEPGRSPIPPDDPTRGGTEIHDPASGEGGH